MFVNKFFINKQNGIRPNAINSWLLWGIVVLALLGGSGWTLAHPLIGQAADKTQTYTQSFQNTTTTLSGDAVEANMYFIKMDYWQVKKVTINLNFQVSQLTNRETSDITLSLNGTKFESFRPRNQTGLQTKTVNVPLRLLQGENQLKISGQIVTKAGDKGSQRIQTPANWLTIYSGANANFTYQLKAPTTAIKSFYAHFSGTDTIANANSVIILPAQATNGELTAGMYALTGEARTITTENNQIPVTTADTTAAKNADYRLVIATYAHLPKSLQRQIKPSELAQRAVIKTVYHDGHHALIVTARTAQLLQKASRFIANQELMQETTASTKTISAQTATYTSEVRNGGKTQLTTSDDYLTGANHQSSTYFVSLPVDRTNANGSKIRIHFRYAKNLDFKRSLVTVYVNDKALGSKRLTAANADDDELTVSLPKGQALGHDFTIRVAFDLELPGKTATNNAQTPWALIRSNSEATIKSQPVADLLLTNYPYLFLKNDTFNQLAVVRPSRLTADDYQTLTNIFNLIGTYAKSNTGQIKFYTHQPSSTVLKNSNVIAFGTPQQNAFIRALNSKLYFKYNRHFTGFVSNEKLSIEKTYGQNIGTVQLLRSPYNSHSGLLVVTAAKSSDVYRASTQINFQRNIAQYQGDAIVVDHDNNHNDYRFKKHATVKDQTTVKTVVQKNSKLVLYLGIAVLIMVLILIAGFLIIRKNGLLERRDDHHE